MKSNYGSYRIVDYYENVKETKSSLLLTKLSFYFASKHSSLDRDLALTLFGSLGPGCIEPSKVISKKKSGGTAAF